MSRTAHPVADAEELAAEGDRVIAEIDGLEIGVFRSNGALYAIANYCVHQGGPLCDGQLSGYMTVDDDGWEWNVREQGNIIACPWHGWKFDITTGQSVKTDRYSVPTFDVETVDGTVFVKR